MNQAHPNSKTFVRQLTQAVADADPGPLPFSHQYVPELENARECLLALRRLSPDIQRHAQALENAAQEAASVNPVWQWLGALSHVVASALAEIEAFEYDETKARSLFPSYLRVSDAVSPAAVLPDDPLPFAAPVPKDDEVMCSCGRMPWEGHAIGCPHAQRKPSRP